MKDILLLLSTFPDPTAEAALGPVVRFAHRNGNSISGLALEIDIHEPSAPLVPLIDVHAMASAAKARSREAGDRLLQGLKELCGADRVPMEARTVTCWWPSLYSEVAINLSRVHDLTVVPLDSNDGQKRRLAEDVLFGSGRPVLLVPETVVEIARDEIVVAWDYSRSSSRAVLDAMPLLSAAQRIEVVTVVGEKEIAQGSTADLKAHFARHGLTIEYNEIAFPAAGQRLSDVLQNHAASRGAGMLIMGAYGHSSFREFVLGGATRGVLDGLRMPVFLSH
jgi:nucleotide-binding universal stress UspA family protein